MVVSVSSCTNPTPLLTAPLARHMIAAVILLSPCLAFGTIFHTCHTACSPKPQICVPTCSTSAAYVSFKQAFGATLSRTPRTLKWSLFLVKKVKAIVIWASNQIRSGIYDVAILLVSILDKLFRR